VRVRQSRGGSLGSALLLKVPSYSSRVEVRLLLSVHARYLPLPVRPSLRPTAPLSAASRRNGVSKRRLPLDSFTPHHRTRAAALTPPASAPAAPRPPPPSRTNRTRLVPPPVLIGHASSLPRTITRRRRRRAPALGLPAAQRQRAGVERGTQAPAGPEQSDSLLLPLPMSLLYTGHRVPPPLPTVAPTHVPTVHSPCRRQLNPPRTREGGAPAGREQNDSLLLPLPMSLLYTGRGGRLPDESRRRRKSARPARCEAHTPVQICDSDGAAPADTCEQRPRPSRARHHPLRRRAGAGRARQRRGAAGRCRVEQGEDSGLGG
jgi:hypothetical protein